MVNTIYKSTEDMINKLQKLKGKTNLNFFKKISNYYDQRNIIRQIGAFQFEEDLFSKDV